MVLITPNTAYLWLYNIQWWCLLSSLSKWTLMFRTPFKTFTRRLSSSWKLPIPINDRTGFSKHFSLRLLTFREGHVKFSLAPLWAKSSLTPPLWGKFSLAPPLWAKSSLAPLWAKISLAPLCASLVPLVLHSPSHGVAGSPLEWSPSRCSVLLGE